MWTRSLVLLLVLGSYWGCTKKMNNKTPEGALESYVSAAFSVSSAADKNKLLALSAGEARAQLESMSDEDFLSKFGKNALQLISLSMKDRRSEKDGGVSLVYELSYRAGSGDAGPVSYKKIAYLIRESDETGWQVRGTKNIKEYVELSGPMVIEVTK